MTDDRQSLFALGHLLLEAGLKDEARTLWLGAGELYPDDVEPCRVLALLALEAEAWGDTVTHATAALERDGSDVRARLVRAIAWVRLGRRGEADEDLARIPADGSPLARRAGLLMTALR